MVTKKKTLKCKYCNDTCATFRELIEEIRTILNIDTGWYWDGKTLDEMMRGLKKLATENKEFHAEQLKEMREEWVKKHGN